MVLGELTIDYVNHLVNRIIRNIRTHKIIGSYKERFIQKYKQVVQDYIGLDVIVKQELAFFGVCCKCYLILFEF